jgi:hypothetical protein
MMNYAKVVTELRTGVNAITLATRRLAWSVRRTIPDTIQRTVQTRIEKMKQESEPFRRLPRTEHGRIVQQLTTEETRDRALAAGVARRNVEPLVEPLAVTVRAYVETRRRDVGISFPSALDHFTPGDMIALELLRETLRPQIESASVDDLTARYHRAFERRDARGLIEAELIEQRIERGGVARTPDEVAVVKALADSVEAMREMRIDELETLRLAEDAIEEARKVISRADIAQVRAINPEFEPAAKAAHDAAAQEFEAEAAGQ